jgi:GMP synthase (glutamine-hydrolysing)
VPDTAALLVVQHQDTCPPALFADWLADAGLDLDVRRPYRGEALPVDLAEHAGLLVLGGTMGAHDDAEHPWLPLTKALLRHAVEVDAPALGICLGHQLAAVALGGTSRRNPDGRTVGVRPIGWCSADASSDPVCGPLTGAEQLVTHWNGDVVTDLPDGAVVLARTVDGAPQVFRLGPRAWGVQFHPEVDHAVVSVWAEEDRHKTTGGGPDVDEALQQVKEAEPALHRSGRRLADAFAGVVAGRR